MDINITLPQDAWNVVLKHDGMGQETVEALVAESGNPYDIVDEATYNAKVAAIPVRAILEPR